MEGGIEENDSMAGIMYLKEWLIYQKSDKYVARGYVENHPRFFDGVWIRTSWIERIYYDEKANAIRIVTHSKHIYILFIDEINDHEDWLDDTKYSLQKLGVSADVYLMRICSTLRKHKMELLSKMENNDLYIEIGYEYLKHVYFKHNNELMEINSRHRIIENDGEDYFLIEYNLPDIVHLGHYEISGMKLEIYSMSDSVRRIVIDNDTKYEVEIDDKKYPSGISIIEVKGDHYE